MFRTLTAQRNIGPVRPHLSAFVVWLLIVTSVPNLSVQAQTFQPSQAGMQSQQPSQVQAPFSGSDSDYCAQPENATSPECGSFRQDDQRRLLNQPTLDGFPNAMGNRSSYSTFDSNGDSSLDFNTNPRQKTNRGNTPEYRVT